MSHGDALDGCVRPVEVEGLGQVGGGDEGDLGLDARPADHGGGNVG